jgi:hypothetical protein
MQHPCSLAFLLLAACSVVSSTTLSSKLSELKSAHAAGLLSDAELEHMRASLLSAFTDSPTAATPTPDSSPDADQWSLVWSDDFTSPKINRSKWRHEITAGGGGNWVRSGG